MESTRQRRRSASSQCRRWNLQDTFVAARKLRAVTLNFCWSAGTKSSMCSNRTHTGSPRLRCNRASTRSAFSLLVDAGFREVQLVDVGTLGLDVLPEPRRPARERQPSKRSSWTGSSKCRSTARSAARRPPSCCEQTVVFFGEGLRGELRSERSEERADARRVDKAQPAGVEDLGATIDGGRGRPIVLSARCGSRIMRGGTVPGTPPTRAAAGQRAPPWLRARRNATSFEEIRHSRSLRGGSHRAHTERQKQRTLRPWTLAHNLSTNRIMEVTRTEATDATRTAASIARGVPLLVYSPTASRSLPQREAHLAQRDFAPPSRKICIVLQIMPMPSRFVQTKQPV